jgi:proteasome accessory factor C
MPETAAEQLNRIVTLVAELSRRGAGQRAPAPLDDVARNLGVTPAQVLRDIRVLTEAADDPDTAWLASFSAYQEGDRISVSSRGAYQRPIRLTSEELLAIQVALATDPEAPSPMLRELAELANAPPGQVEQLSPAPFLQDQEAAVVNLVRLAANTRRRMRLVYAGEGEPQASERSIDPHAVIYANGVFYIVAWCDDALDWRHFRVERVLEAEILAEPFERRAVPEITDAHHLFRAPAETVEEVRVRFTSTIARWLAERYPDGERQRDGSFVVTLRSASIEWAVRTVLQYGPEAEILSPPSYRDAMRRAVA